MDSNNTPIINGANPVDAILTDACGGEAARRNMETVSEGGLETDEDRERFQRYEASCHERPAKNARRFVTWDNSKRYMDKPFSRVRPRPPSPEYEAFKRELAAEKALRALFDL